MRTGTEVSWILEGKTPDQIPMTRLGEYLQQLGALLGEVPSVHLARVEKGSTRIVAKLDAGLSAQRVQARAYAVRDGRAPRDAVAAFERLQGMVREDQGRARLQFGSATILRFRGNSPMVAQPLRLHDTGTITGKLYALSEGQKGRINARIRPQHMDGYIPCTADLELGDQLRGHLFEAVRVRGRGWWFRAEAGGWQCQSLHIAAVGGVRNASLREAIKALRAIEVDWEDDPLAGWEHMEERNGAA